MKNFEKKIINEADEQSAAVKEINEKDSAFRNEINAYFEKGNLEEVRDKLKQYRQFLLNYHDKQDVDEILAKYYERLEKL